MGITCNFLLFESSPGISKVENQKHWLYLTKEVEVHVCCVPVINVTDIGNIQRNHKKFTFMCSSDEYYRQWKQFRNCSDTCVVNILSFF